MQLWSINWNVIKIQLLPVLQQLSESVTSVQGGVIATQGFDEIVCSTYAGQNDLRIYFNFFIYLKKVKYNWMCMYAKKKFNVIQKRYKALSNILQRKKHLLVLWVIILIFLFLNEKFTSTNSQACELWFSFIFFKYRFISISFYQFYKKKDLRIPSFLWPFYWLLLDDFRLDQCSHIWAQYQRKRARCLSSLRPGARKNYWS